MTYLTSPKVAGKSAVIAPPKSSTGLNPDMFNFTLLSMTLLLLAGWWCASSKNCFSPVSRTVNVLFSNICFGVERCPEQTRTSVLILYSFGNEVESQSAVCSNV